MRTQRTLLATLVAWLMASAAASPAPAEELRVQRWMGDSLGNETLLFRLSDARSEAIVGPSLPPLSAIGIEVEHESRTSRVELDQPTLRTLGAYGAPFRIYLLLPNTDRFNGSADDPARPDASGLRAGVLEALSALPPDRSDIHLHVGFYNEEVRWIPEVTTTGLDVLSRAFTQPETIAPPGTAIEDVFNAIDNAYRTKLRRQARELGSSDFVIFFVIVTSASTSSPEMLATESERLRGLLSEGEVADVVTSVIVYDPVLGEEGVQSPEGAPARLAQGLTPETGNARIAGSEPAFRAAIRATLEEIASMPVLRFSNDVLEYGDERCSLRMVIQRPDGPLESNVLQLALCPTAPTFPYWTVVRVLSAVLFGLVLVSCARKGRVGARTAA